jgi:integrase
MRASAFVTLPIEAVDIERRAIRQWPELGVLTKNGKRATTYLLPVPELLSVVEAWDKYVRAQLPLSGRWYAPIQSRRGEHKLSSDAPGLRRNHALGKRLRLLYQAADLPYKSPHKFRHGHAVYGLQHAESMNEPRKMHAAAYGGLILRRF